MLVDGTHSVGKSGPLVEHGMGQRYGFLLVEPHELGGHQPCTNLLSRQFSEVLDEPLNLSVGPHAAVSFGGEEGGHVQRRHAPSS